jgi:predicted helicase
MTVAHYVTQLNQEYRTGSATEHSYRSYLKELIEAIDPRIIAINEPRRIKAGAPDYLIATRDEHIEIGYIEAKDIGKDIHAKSYKEQFDRYKNGLENLIITDYMEFEFYRDGERHANIRIAEQMLGQIYPIEENFEAFIHLIEEFTAYTGQTITSSSRLAEMMAAKAKIMADVMRRALQNDIDENDHTEIAGQYATFKQVLISDMKPKDFADMYAQTITYGMFTARFHDETLPTFSREEAATLVPHSNPFLRKLFQHLAGYDLDERIVWIVESLVKIFRATDVRALLETFGHTTQRNDPIIHFYEEFLAAFDPKLRKARGVWYTPEPVVKFIIRSVDDLLKTHFDLEEGLSDTTRTTITVEDKDAGYTPSGKPRTKEREVHRVQVLDPATGTGTFLSEIIQHVKENFYGGGWSRYVEDELIPRLHGFEIVMASYAMAHLKLDLLLKLTGYTPQSQQRFGVYLTNSLEEHHKEADTLFASFLAEESQQADRIKKETPVMVVVGNPPYAVSSSNKSEWIQNLIADYKKDLNERNIQPLSDDYIKFIRYGQHYIDKNGEGILAYISNNSFIDGIIHRQMRKSLLGSFDTIYILDLHGNSKKKETAPDGSRDENVFDIM